MPVVTHIKPQKNKKRVNICLDGKFGFGLDLESFVKSGIKLDQELTDSQIKEIVKKGEFQKNLDKLLHFATLRPRSEYEIIKWMRKHKVHNSLQKELFDKLRKLSLLDDEKFAKWWIDQRKQFKFKSKREMAQELKIKGVVKQIIEKVLDEEEIDEDESAKMLVEKRFYKWERLNVRDRKLKISQFLARKGFDWEVIKKVVEDIVNNSNKV